MRHMEQNHGGQALSQESVAQLRHLDVMREEVFAESGLVVRRLLRWTGISPCFASEGALASAVNALLDCE